MHFQLLDVPFRLFLISHLRLLFGRLERPFSLQVGSLKGFLLVIFVLAISSFMNY